MSRYLIAFLLLIGASPVMAADNSELPVCTGITTGNCANKEEFANTDVGGVKFPNQIPHNSSGDEIFTDANPGKVTGVGLEDGDDPTSYAHIGCQGLATAKTAVTATKMAGCVSERDGRIVTVPFALSGDYLYGLITTAMTSTTSTAVTGMGAQGGSLRVYVTACTISNMDDTTATEVLLQDGSGGSTLWTIPASINGGGGHVVFPTPIRTTANTALYAANATSGATTKVSCTGYKAI